MKNVMLIVRNQFEDMIREPIVLFIIGLISIILILNAAACATIIPSISEDSGHLSDPFFTQGISNPLSEMMQLIAALSMFIGVLTIAEEKASGSLKLLLTKPLYRRDVFAGKFIGLSLLLLVVVIFLVMLNISTVIIFSRGPYRRRNFYFEYHRISSFSIFTAS